MLECRTVLCYTVSIIREGGIDFMTDRELLETMFIEQRLMALKIKRMSEELSEVQSVTTRIEENQEFMEIELKSIRA